MEPRRTSLFWLAGSALVLFLALLFAPMSHWLVTQQLHMQFGPDTRLLDLMRDLGIRDLPGPRQVDRSPEQATLRAVAERHPNDYGLQLAVHSNIPATVPGGKPGSVTAVDNLHALAERFPNQPSVYANAMRLATMGPVRAHRDENYLLTGTPIPANRSGQPSSPEVLAAFDRDAAAGERLDPDNAYFPMMRAIGLFEQKRDDEALAALDRASRTTRFDDYAYDEVRGRLRLSREAFGRTGAIARLATQSALLFPHFAGLRGVARVATYKAIEAEAAGHTAQGLAIRRSLMRCGSLMRGQSPSIIGSLVGIAIAAIGTSRPGGAPAAKSDPDLSADTRRENHIQEYEAYLNKIGQADEARWARTESDTGVKVKALIQKGMDDYWLGKGAYSSLVGWWAFDLLVLSNILWLFGLGIAAALVARGRLPEWSVPFLVVGGLFMVAFMIAGVSRSFEIFLMFRQVIANLAAQGSQTQLDIGVQKMAFLVAALTLPVLTLITIAFVGVVRRLEVREAMRVLQNATAVLGCILVLVYGGLVMKTLRAEAQMEYGMDRTLQGEGPFFAELTGNPWPATVHP